MKLKGKVVRRDISGGVHELHTDGGDRYALDGGTFTPGETVTVEGDVLEDGMGIGMTGLPILRVKKVSR